MNQLYYKPSGKMSGMYFLYFVLFTLIGVPILSVAYIYLIHYIPFIYLNFLITIGCGAVLGYMMVLSARHGKARNPTIVFLFTIIALIIMKYIQWCIYIPLVLDNVYELYFPSLTLGERFAESYYLFISPGSVLELAKIINEYGAWSISSTDVTGIMLLLVWIAEFLIMGACALIIPRIQSKVPFSEESGSWYEDMGRKIEMDIPPNFDAIKNSMENGDFTSLVQLAKSERTNSNTFLDVKLCKPPQPSLSEPYYLSIERVSFGANNKRSAKTLIKHIAVGAHIANEITATAVSVHA